MSARTEGSYLYMEGDEIPFTVMMHPNDLMTELENAKQEAFLALPGLWTADETDEDEEEGELDQRTFYIRPKYVKAVSPYLVRRVDG